jgi:large subunit ribosomal protein L32e
MVKFLRRDAKRYSKFGKGKGEKAKWRKPKGRDNKMREKKKGKPAVVSIGYGSKNKEEKIVRVSNVRDLSKVKKGELAYLLKVGTKKKIEIMKKAKEMKIKFKNENVDSFLKKIKKKKGIKENELKK